MPAQLAARPGGIFLLRSVHRAGSTSSLAVARPARTGPQATARHGPSASRRCPEDAHNQAGTLDNTRAAAVTSALLGLLAAQAIGGPIGSADAIDRVAEFTASGLIFKDSVEVLAVDDNEVQGVTVYISDFRRSLTDKLAKDFFSEPSQASIFCAQTAPQISIRDIENIKGTEGREMFSQQKNLNLFQNKTLRVRRIYDEARQTLVYVAYSTRLTNASDKDSISAGRYKSSMCVVPLSRSLTPVSAPAMEDAAAQ
eukprot:CAMPEP_0117664290 /NCGR_PEP_ID=MMETSP0804-20121206/9131_1 /TAXON_ID=1074897 /ORGANISM="Tetraselmis astigmatica, Strain CCMP880" /LENGTH=254 /DNA_ID=CAMNT_0005471493 /DNA_START=98 /DNA_END=862 /DNA_ORIENTATION=-